MKINKYSFENLFVVSVEVEATPESEMWSVAKGAYLFCLVPENDAGNAAEVARKALQEDYYNNILIEEVVQFENMKWKSRKVKKEYLK